MNYQPWLCGISQRGQYLRRILKEIPENCRTVHTKTEELGPQIMEQKELCFKLPIDQLWDALTSSEPCTSLNSICRLSFAIVNEDELSIRATYLKELESLKIIENFIDNLSSSDDAHKTLYCILTTFLRCHTKRFTWSLPLSLTSGLNRLMSYDLHRSYILHLLCDLISTEKNCQGDLILFVLNSADEVVSLEFLVLVSKTRTAWRQENYNIISYLLSLNISTVGGTIAPNLHSSIVAAFVEHHSDPTVQKSVQFAKLLQNYLRCHQQEIPAQCKLQLNAISMAHTSFLKKSLSSTIMSL